MPGFWHPVLRDSLSGQAELFRWGISESKMGQNSRLVFAVKIEDLVSRQSRHLLERRVIVPVEAIVYSHGGVQWQIRGQEPGALALAGVWDVDGHWRGRPVRAFRVITGPTIEGFERLGPRMPIVMQPEQEKHWLWHFTEEDAALDALEPNKQLLLEKI